VQCGSIPRDPAGPPYPRPRCLSLHIRPLGICSRFADRGLSVFVIEGPPLPPFFWRAPSEAAERCTAAVAAEVRVSASEPEGPSGRPQLPSSSRATIQESHLAAQLILAAGYPSATGSRTQGAEAEEAIDATYPRLDRV
jgi:hypothetical protein